MRAIHYPPPEIVGAQIDAVLEDFAVAAIKIGMLGSAEIANVVAERLPSPHSPSRDGRPLGEGAKLPWEKVRRRAFQALSRRARGRMRAFIVYDPVMIASSGDALSGSGFVEAIRHALLPLVDCLTPNLAEAAALLGEPIAAERSGHGAPGRGAAEAWPARDFDEGRSP